MESPMSARNLRPKSVTLEVMDELAMVDVFDLRTQGDRHEREFWPLLCDRFPSYQTLWRRLVVPLTFRIDPSIPPDNPRWIRLRPEIPEEPYERLAMVHYSVFYFLGRAVQRLAALPMIEYPEDILFLLDSAGDNCKCFMKSINDIAKDSTGGPIFPAASIAQFTKTAPPFDEISAYRDVLLHNAVIGRAEDVEGTYLPRWNRNSGQSPLARAKTSWRAAARLSGDDRISTRALLDRLTNEACVVLERYWQTVVTATQRGGFRSKILSVSQLKNYLPLRATDIMPPAASGSYITSTITPKNMAVTPATHNAAKDG